MGACPIHRVKCLLSAELQTRQFHVRLQDSDVSRTETILAQPLPEQTEADRPLGEAGRGFSRNVDGMPGSFGSDCRLGGFPREGSCERRLVKMRGSRGRNPDNSARSGQFEGRGCKIFQLAKNPKKWDSKLTGFQRIVSGASDRGKFRANVFQIRDRVLRAGDC
jgi:hypothetical protein